MYSYFIYYFQFQYSIVTNTHIESYRVLSFFQLINTKYYSLQSLLSQHYYSLLLNPTKYSFTYQYYPILLIIAMNLFPFLVNFLDVFIRISNYLDTIILWLCQCCSVRLECTQVVFGIAVVFKRLYFVFLKFSQNSNSIKLCELYSVVLIIAILISCDFWLYAYLLFIKEKKRKEN